MKIAFRINRISKIYQMGNDEVHALNEISLEVPEGDFTIMGPSTTGKSTLLNILGCLDRPTTGSYELSGVSVAEMADQDLALLRADSIGFIFQSYNLIPYLPYSKILLYHPVIKMYLESIVKKPSF